MPAPKNRAPSTKPIAPANRRWFEITNLAEAGVAEIRLRGYIGMPTTERDWMTGELVASGGAGTLQEFEAELEALGPVKKIQLSIFSEGGDVFTGMAIHNLLVRHSAKKTCFIDGICASAATYPALACGEIQMPANAWMMIHGSEGCCCGNAQAMRKYADMLDSVNASIVNLYAARTGKSADEIMSMIEEETWMDGSKAVELGFADTVIEPLQNLAARAASLQPTNSVMLRNAPAEVLALFDMSRISNANRAPIPTAMLKLNTPLLNAATDTPPAGGGAAPAQSAAPAAAPVASIAPVNAAPVAPATPAAPAPTAPVNAAPVITLTQEQLQQMMTNAATAAVNAHVQNLANHGISPQNLGGAQPVANVNTPDAPADLSKLTPLQLINLGRKKATIPAPSAN